jgi:hypothetical protein
MSTTDIKKVVKEKYGQAALRVKTGGSSRASQGFNSSDATATSRIPGCYAAAAFACVPFTSRSA